MDDIIIKADNADEKAFEGVQAHKTVYGGIKIDTARKQQLESQPAAEFLAFDKNPDDGGYIMRYKLPERGRINKKDIDIRRNLNYFLRGLARYCMDDNGNVNFKWFDTFYEQYDDRNMNLFCTPEFADTWGVPEDKRAEFFLYLKNCFEQINNVLTGFETMALDMRQIQYSMNELYKPDQPVDRAKEKILLDSYPDFMKMLDNLHKLADMDPETETQIYYPVDCGLSASLNRHILAMVNEYRKTNQLQPVPSPEKPPESKGGKFAIQIDKNRPDEPELSNYNDFKTHGCFVLNADLNGRKVVLSLETTASPTWKRFFHDQKGETGMGVYNDLDELRDYHWKNGFHHVEHFPEMYELKTIPEEKVSGIGNMTGSHIFDMKLRTSVKETSHTMDELSRRLASWEVDHPLKVSSAEFAVMKECFEKLVNAKTDEEKSFSMFRLNVASQVYLDYKEPKGDGEKAKALSDYAKRRLEFVRDVLDYTSASILKEGKTPALISELKATGELKKILEQPAHKVTMNDKEKKVVDTLKNPEKVKNV